MKKMLSLAALVMALVMAGCSPFALVNSETYNNADLADYHTFRIVTPDEGYQDTWPCRTWWGGFR